MLLKNILKVSPYIFVFFLFFLTAVDTDLGWHLRYGEHFVNTGKILKENVLTYYLPDFIWSHSYSLYQILTALIYKISGLVGLAIAYGLLGTLIFHLFTRLTKSSDFLSLLTFLFFVIVSWNVFGLGWRAQIFTIIFLLIELLLLQRVGENSKWFFAIPPVFLFWANTHGGFVVGLIILLLWLIQKIFERDSRGVLLVGLSFMLSILATLINPFGSGIWQETIKHSQYPLHTLIAEWLKPEILVSASSLIITSVLVFFLWSRKVADRVFKSLILLLGFLLLLEARRNTAIFALFASLVFLDIFKDKFEKYFVKSYVRQFGSLLIISSVIILTVLRIPETLNTSTNWQTYCNEGMLKYPCNAIEYLKNNRFENKNIYSAYEWGGFLSWQLPKNKYFVDGRMPAWPTSSGKSPYTEYLEIIQAQPDWDQKLKAQNTDLLLIGAGTFLDLELKASDEVLWKEEYRDETSVIYTKK